MSKAAVGENYDQIMINLSDRVRQISTIHYRNTVEQVSRLVWEAGWLPSNIETGGAQTIKYRTVGGGLRGVRTKPWPALNRDYAASKPANTQFWRKLSNRLGSLGQAMAMQVTPDKAVVTTRVIDPVRSHHKDRVNAHLTIWFHSMPEPLDTMLSVPFATGVPIWDHNIDVGSTEERIGLQRLFPEMKENRPFIGLVAAKLGEDLRKQLRKL